MDRPLWLSGFMASGKTTVGRRVAHDLGVPFLDLDEQISREIGKSISDVFADDGEPVFRSHERRLALRLLDDPVPRVVAAGGGTLLDAEVHRLAMRHALVVTLHVRLQDVLRRLAGGEARPLARSDPERLASLLRLRAGAYAASHAGVWNAERPIDAVVSEVVAYARGTAVPVSLGPRSHPIHVERGSLSSVGDRVCGWSPRGPVAVVVDRGLPRSHVRRVLAGLRRAGLSPRCYDVAAGDASKSTRTVRRLWDRILGAGFSRWDPVVALGGGMVTDLAGFVASTALRGMPLFNVPTTVLSQLDAAIGGKTALNHASGKNRIGTFHTPRAVVADPEVLSTLPPRERAAGLAEAVKCGLALDPEILVMCETRAASLREGDPDALEAVIRLAARAKARVVSVDELETGEGPTPGRMVLNVGHTVGHALEAAGGFGDLLHGEAVAMGLVAMARLSVALAGAPAALVDRTVSVLAALGLPARLGPLDERAASFLPADKKAEGDVLRLVLLRDFSDPVLMEVPAADVVVALSR